MAAYYLQPHVQNGRTKGGFRLIRAANRRSAGPVRRKRRYAARSMLITLAVNLLLWTAIASIIS